MNKKLFKPSHLKELCQKYNLSPSKKYGQNYLITDAPIKKMIDVAELKKTDTVIEIGPGFGVLTFALVEEVNRVIAFEIERKLEGYWDDNKTDNLDIVWGNALKELTACSLQLTAGYKVVANIPYQITSNLLRVLLESENKPESITMMVQKEVAERICAKPGDMSVLAVSVQYYGEPKIITKVSKGNFWPSPKVDSAVLHISTLALEQQSTREFDDGFFKVVKAGFTNKRKQLWRNLSEGLKLPARNASTSVAGGDREEIKKILVEVVGDEKIRAEELSVENWKEITKMIR